MELPDVAKLQDELRELSSARQEVNERLRMHSGGRGPPPHARGQRDRHPRPPLDARPPPPLAAPLADDPPPRRPLISSSVVAVSAPLDDGRQDRKRPAEGALMEENADVKRRNKRLFGAILGTLQRFSRDEQEARSTAAAQRRAELERRAEERKAEEGRKLRQQARDEMRQIRDGDVARKREISAQAACKRLEILYATRLARADKLCGPFLLTATGPRLYWRPAKPSVETERLGEARRQEHEAWKAAELVKMKEEAAELFQMLTRRRGGGAQLPGGGDAEGGGGEGQEGEDGDEEMEGQQEGEEQAEGMDEEEAGPQRAQQQEDQQPQGGGDEPAYDKPAAAAAVQEPEEQAS